MYLGLTNWQKDNSYIFFKIISSPTLIFNKYRIKIISSKKKRIGYISFVLKIIQNNLVIGCINSVKTNQANVIILQSDFRFLKERNYFIRSSEIYSDTFLHIDMKEIISVGDVVIAKIENMDCHLSIYNANLGVLFSLGNHKKFLIPESYYELRCPVTGKKSFKKISILSIW